MLEGAVLPKLQAGRSQANPGVYPLSKLAYTQKFEPLPAPLGTPPYHYDLQTAVPGIDASAAKLGKLVFHVVGDTGGVKNPDHQTAVAELMVKDLAL